MTESAPAGVANEPPRHEAAETYVAVRNAFVLASSLAGTWAVALVVKLFLPRRLGPDLFGAFNFADVLAMTTSVLLDLGLDTYIRKELPVRPRHADDFLGTGLLARVGIAIIVGMVTGSIVVASHRPPTVLATVLLFVVGQLLLANNNTFAAVLHAARAVDRLAVVNVGSKLLWAGAVLVALSMRAGLPWLALAFVASEGVRSIVLWRHLRRRFHVVLRVDWAATRRVLGAASPFFVNAVAIMFYARIDVNIMALVLSDREVGWYGAAGNVAGIAMLMAPLMSAILMPQLARAAGRSNGELLGMFRRSLEIVLACAIPVSMLMFLSARLVVARVFGPAFAPAVRALELLSPMFVLTYLAMLSSTCLILQGRSWRVTVISLSSVALNAVLNLTLLRPAVRLFGEGGGGTAAAAISVLTEIVAATAVLASIGRSAFDARLARSLAIAFAACVVALVVDRFLLDIGALRMVVAVAVYAVIVVAAGGVRVRELVELARAARLARGEHANVA